ncbi:hypothetical protein [Tabrizicola flagellatus]|nr:hypothetical protein [Tabrizicola flagellatus]
MTGLRPEGPKSLSPAPNSLHLLTCRQTVQCLQAIEIMKLQVTQCC